MKHKHIRYTLLLKGLIFFLGGLYLCMLGIPSIRDDVTYHVGMAVTEDITNPTTPQETQETLSKRYRLLGPVIVIIGFLEIILAILTLLKVKDKN